MLRNPTYKGQAAFGRRKTGVKLSSLRPSKNSIEHSKNNFSLYSVEKENWIYVPVPAIINENLFDVVQEQLEENKKRARTQLQRGATYLLQGLLVCKNCSRAYCGITIKKKSKKTNNSGVHSYYKCLGTVTAKFGGSRMCNNEAVNATLLESIIWEEVKKLLKHPQRIFDEYQRRLTESEKSPLDQTYDSIEKQRIKLERGISLLIDSYAQEYILKKEFEPRIKTMRQNLKSIQEQQKKIVEQKNSTKDIKLIITSLKDFEQGVGSKLDNLDWDSRRDIIRRVVKRVEVGEDKINIVYKITELPTSEVSQKSLQHCRNRISFGNS